MWLSKPASKRLPSSLTFAAALGLSLLASAGATAQTAVAPDMPDPSRAVVIVDDAGYVGLRISDAQAVHETVISHLRERLGKDAVVYEGLKKNAAKMKSMLGKDAETQIQQTQLDYFEAAEKAAPWRVRVRFSQKKGRSKNAHSITVACRKAGASIKKTTDSKTVTGATFLAARDGLREVLPAFCLELPDAAVMAIPIEGATDPTGRVPTNAGNDGNAGNAGNEDADEVPGLQDKKPIKPWSPPPRRG